MNRPTDEEIEAISNTFYDKYAGKGLSPSEVMELHKSEYWDTIFQAEHSRLAAMAPEEVVVKIKAVPKQIFKGKEDTKDTKLAYLAGWMDGSKAQLAKVWPIVQAKIERTKKLAEAGGYLKGQRAEREKAQQEVDELLTRFEKYYASGEERQQLVLAHIKEHFEVLKRGKMPGEAKSDLA